MIDKSDTVAIVGASNNEEKYGYIVTADLISKGYDVVPVNNHEVEILGKEVYSSLKDIEPGVDAVIFVVPPEVTKKVLLDVKVLGIKKVWMQPGSESDEAIKFCGDNGIECMHNSCIMLQ